MMNFEPQKLEPHFDIHHSIFCGSAVQKLKSDGLSAPLRGPNHKAFGSAGAYLILGQAPGLSFCRLPILNLGIHGDLRDGADDQKGQQHCYCTNPENAS